MLDLQGGGTSGRPARTRYLHIRAPLIQKVGACKKVNAAVA